MIHDYITPDRIANSIMQDELFEGSHLVVEGYLDSLFYSKFNHENCKIQIGFGKQKVRGTIKILNERNFFKAVGIIDSDFDNIENTNHQNNVINTDFHDLEMMAIESNSFNNAISHFGNPSKVLSLELQRGMKLKDIFFSLIKPLSYLKLANMRHNLGLSFKPKNDDPELDIADFIDLNNLTYKGDEKLIQTVMNYSRNRSDNMRSVSGVNAAFIDAKSNQFDLLQLCNGHDICSLISLSCRRKINNLNANKCKKEDIEQFIVLSYDSSYFCGTYLYIKLKEWEQINSLSVLRI